MDIDKMKPLPTFVESFAQLQAAIQDNAGEVGVRFEAVVTHLINIRNFYIVPLNRYKLLHIMEKPGSKMADCLKYSTVIYLSSQLRRYARGVVNRVKPDKSYDIFAIDYGVTDVGVTQEKIFNFLHPEAESVPGLAQLCELNMCHPINGKEFTREAQECFNCFMGEHREALLITVKEVDNQKLSVLVMSSQSNPDDVSTALAYLHHSRYYAAPL